MTSSSFNMIDLKLLSPGRLRDDTIGPLFVAFSDDTNPWITEPYLRGDINGTDVRILLRGEKSFEVKQADHWPNRPGFSVPDVSIEVDRGSAEFRRGEEDCKKGELILHPNGCSLVTVDDHHRHIVDLFGNVLEDSANLVMVAFKRWEIVSGRGATRQVLYHYTGRELLFGPFDPEVDDE